MYPYPLFLNVRLYGIMIAVGVLCAFGVLYLYGKKLKISEKLLDFVFYDGVASILLGFLSATLFQSVYNYLENPEAGFSFGGMTFIGGLIGGAAVFLAAYFVLRKKLGIRLTDVLSVIPCSIVIAHGFGRIGCFFAGCCYGKPTDSFLGVQFPNHAVKVHPTQLYEAAFLFLLFALFSFLVLKKGFRQNLSLYLVLYGVFRFLIEYVRGDDRGQFIGIFSPSQFWSVFMVAIGIGLYFALEAFFKKQAEKENTEQKSE
ncbi:MAG: prolipoprotein diacylglyceryl transferase [Clostridia bacterium]|nr:prolipoprotein diacylglyceryl transferase [Clostridia bacterium]